MAQYYPYEAYREEFAPAVEDEASMLRRWNRRYSLNKLCHFVEQSEHEGGRLLDVGCGTGNFLAQMRERGAWKVFGLDVNQKAVRYARQRLQIEAFCGTLTDAQYPSAFFDVVTLWNVLEHLHSPIRTLEEVRRVLRPGGALILSVPNSRSMDARLFGPHWIGLDPPRHLYTFDQRTLRLLLAQAGFRILEVGHVTGSYHSFVTSTCLLLQGRESLPQRTRKRLCRWLSSWAVHLLIFPYLKAVEVSGRGPILTVRAKAAQPRDSL
jgi:2-polyprenyl-3-methyl-5-hydroxy-6-metoxy-1,4-benzoquinol methylase